MASHNLDVSMYSLDELLGLFDLNYDITMDGIKKAKHKVLMLHPDKSRLPPEYFIFYKKAFEVVVRYYEEQTRQNKAVPSEPISYTQLSSVDKNTKRVINEMKKSDFHAKFNTMFEQNMSVKPDQTRNEWFTRDEPLYENEKMSNLPMNSAFDAIKQKNSAMIRHRGVQTLGGGGTNLYDDDDIDDSYVTCDPFSKLKYDDLRKVHKDQTVLAVGEKDFEQVRKYNSVDHLMQERGTSLSPLEKADAQRMMDSRQKEHEQMIMRKQHAANLKSMEYAEKNKSVLGSFLRLGN
jgi:hypothetical protein